jgi:DNA-binding NarL/FixJ family response regulator
MRKIMGLAGMNRIRILLAEDEKVTALDLTLGLKKIGYNVVKVVDKGFDLIREAINSEPDVIVSDINLKDSIDGIQAMSDILERKKIPFVMISGFNDELTRSAVEALKPCAFIRKPCSAREIDSVIVNCFQA